MEKLENISFREEYYDEIHEMKPQRWMGYFLPIIFVIILLLIFLAYFIKYPDVIHSEIRLISDNPAVTIPIINKRRVDAILINNNDTVYPQTHLLTFKSDSDFEDVMKLKNIINTYGFSKKNNKYLLDSISNFELRINGVIDKKWSELINLLLEYSKLEEFKFYESKINIERNKIRYKEGIKSLLEDVVKSDSIQKKLIENQYIADSILFIKDVYGELQFKQKEQNYYNKINLLQQNNLKLEELRVQIAESENSIINLKLLESINKLENENRIKRTILELKNSIYAWEINNLICSPICGRVSFIQHLNPNSYFEGDAMIISPFSNQYFATAKIPILGAGKIKIGQEVILKLDDYPYREYGVVIGKLVELSNVSGENHYLAKVSVSNNMVTTYHKKIEFKENMRGVGEIITNDRSFLSRIFEKIIYALKK